MIRTDRDRIIREFHDAVNMTARQLQTWLDTDASHEVGWRRNPGDESVGHESGRRIVSVLRKRAGALTDDDLMHMRRVVGFVHRHLAQRPFKDISKTRWAYSLKNWGHDPTRT